MKPKPIVWNGQEFPSIAAAADTLGISKDTLYVWLKRGYCADSDVPDKGMGYPRPIVWEGVEYPSLAHAARALGITKEAMRQRADKGYSSERDFGKAGRPTNLQNS